MSENMAEAGARTYASQDAAMLAARAASALVLAAVALGANAAGVIPFAILTAVVAALVSWEWGRIARGQAFDAPLAIHAGTVLLAVALAASGLPVWSMAALAAGAASIAFAVRTTPGLSAFGAIYAGAPAVALVWLRGADPMGASAVLFIFLSVWIYDTMAFVAGSWIGGPKLWPSVSPKKTWSGLAGGVAASAAAGAWFAYVTGAPPVWLALCGAAFGVLAQAGDLFESAVKRGRGVKDASGLVPGHGGVMDRLDSTVAVAVVAGLIALAINPRVPAQALLFGG